MLLFMHFCHNMDNVTNYIIWEKNLSFKMNHSETQFAALVITLVPAGKRFVIHPCDLFQLDLEGQKDKPSH